MNLDKYEKIDGREGLRRLADGETVYGRDSAEWTINENGEVIYQSKFGTCVSGSYLNDFVQHKHLYVKKPFDVRREMLDRPNEWVGAYEQQDERWMKVGFDVKRMRPVRTFMNCEAKVNLHDGRVFVIELEDLNLCIPIEDVPEEATR